MTLNLISEISLVIIGHGSGLVSGYGNSFSESVLERSPQANIIKSGLFGSKVLGEVEGEVIHVGELGGHKRIVDLAFCVNLQFNFLIRFA